MGAVKDFYINGFEFIVKPALKQVYTYYYKNYDQVENKFLTEEAFDLWDCGICSDFDEAVEWAMHSLFNDSEDLYEMLCAYYECMPRREKTFLEYIPIETAIKWMENIFPGYREDYRDFDLNLD